MLSGFGGDDSVLVEVEGGEDGSTGGSLGRHRSYSVSDLRRSLPPASPAPLAPLQDNEGCSRGERGSVSSLNDLPDAQHIYGNISADDYTGGASNAQPPNLLIPVRPSPAPPVNKNKVNQRQQRQQELALQLQQELAQQHFSSSGGSGHPPPVPSIYSNSFLGEFTFEEDSSFPGAVYGNVIPDDGSDDQRPVYYNNVPGAAGQVEGSRNPFGGDPQFPLYDEPPTDEVYSANNFVQSSYQNIEASMSEQWPSEQPFCPPPSTATPSRDLSGEDRLAPSPATHNLESQTSLRNTSGGGVASLQLNVNSSHDAFHSSESSSSSQKHFSGTVSNKLSNVTSYNRLDMISELNNQLGNMWLSSVGSSSRTQSPVPTLPPPSASPCRARPTAASTSSRESLSSDVRGSPVKVLPPATTTVTPASTYGSNILSDAPPAVSSPLPTSISSPLRQSASQNSCVANQAVQNRSISVPVNSGIAGWLGSQGHAVQKRLSSLDPSFIQDLEKNLGRDQASANTFSDSFSPGKINETVVAEIHSPPRVIPSMLQRPNVGSVSAASTTVSTHPAVHLTSVASPSICTSSHLTTQRVNPLLVHSHVPPPEHNTQHCIPKQPSSEAAVVEAQSASADQPRTVFSDLDVKSSSKTLGLQAKLEVDTRKFFPKNTAHVRPILQRTIPNVASSVVSFPYMAAHNDSSSFPTSLPGTRSPYLFAQPSSSSTFSSGIGIPSNAMSSDVSAGRDLRSEFLVAQSQTGFSDQFVQSQPMRGAFTMGTNTLPSTHTQEVTYNLNNSSGWSNPPTYSLSTSVSSSSGAGYNLSTSVSSALTSPPPPPTLTPQEMAEFASPPSSQQQQLQIFGATGQQQPLPLQYQFQLQQIQQQHQQQYGHPLSAQQLKVRLMQIQQQKQQQQELQQQNLQQIQHFRQQQLLQQHQHEQQQRLQQQQQQQKSAGGGLSTPLQPTVVLSPQVTVNYNQLVCAAGRSDRGTATEGAAEALVSRVAAVVPGATVTEARQALHVAAGNYQGAVQYLKVEKLYRLGLTNKADCEQILEENSWELQRSASALLDKFS